MANSGSQIRWEITRGISERMVSEFRRSVFFSERELSLEGVVQSVIDGAVSHEEKALLAFMESRRREYLAWVRETTGDERNADESLPSIRQFIEERGLQDEYDAFSATVEEGVHDDDARQGIVDAKLAPLFNDTRSNIIYVYRDSDHWGLRLSRVLLDS